MKLDPLYFILQDIIPTQLANRFEIQITTIILRGILCFIISVESARLYALSFIILMITVRIAYQYFSKIDNQSIDDFINSSNRFQCLYNFASDAVETTVALAMFIGFIVNVFFNYLTLKGHDLFPMPLYLYFPTAALLIPYIIHHTLLPAIQIHERATASIEKYRVQISDPISPNSWRRKYLVKRIRAMRPFVIYGGLIDFRMYKIQRRTYIEFYFVIVDYTLNVLLSIPIEVFL